MDTKAFDFLCSLCYCLGASVSVNCGLEFRLIGLDVSSCLVVVVCFFTQRTTPKRSFDLVGFFRNELLHIGLLIDIDRKASVSQLSHEHKLASIKVYQVILLNHQLGVGELLGGRILVLF